MCTSVDWWQAVSDSDQLKDALTGALVELVAARRAPVSESPAHPPLELDR
jgi:hypothetical protein